MYFKKYSNWFLYEHHIEKNLTMIAITEDKVKNSISKVAGI